MQKTAKKTAPVTMSGNIPAFVNVVNPARSFAASDSAVWQQAAYDVSYQPTITWQDTTSNATYSSASSVLNIT